MGQLLFYDFQESAQDYVPPLIVQAILLSPVIHHSCTLIMPWWAEPRRHTVVIRVCMFLVPVSLQQLKDKR